MGAQVGLSGRTGRRTLLALFAVLAVWLTVGAVQANAALSLNPSTVGAGIIVTSSGSPAYGGCFNTGHRDDRQVFSCPGANLPAACVPIFTSCFPVTSNLVLAAVPTGVPAGHWSFVRWEGCDSASGTLCTLFNPAFSTRSRAPRAVFNDSVGPTVTGLSVQYSTSTDRGVSFGSITGNETFSAINCRVGTTGSFTPCSQVRQLSEGTHQVFAQGTDLSGNVGAVSGSLATFRVIDTTLVSGPADFSPVKRPTFTYSSLAGLKFECSIDSAAITTPCGDKNPSTNRASFTPAADLPDGVHTFRVEAIDGPDVDRVPVVRTWRVDTVAPVIAGLSSPTITDGVVTTALNATFNWGVTEAGGLQRFECKLDSGAFAPCTSGKTYNDLPFGGHTFSVRGVDKAGNTGPAVSRSWTVAARDEDGDGFNQRSDCNDGNAAINPIAPDVPDNGVDENCDGADATDPDRDDDGFQPPADCNDSNPNIRPGVPDVPDNGVDENCDGSDAKTPPLPRIASTVSFNFPAPKGTTTRFTNFLVKSVPKGATVVARCKGKACGKKAPKQTVKNSKGGTVRLKKFQRKFKAGSTIEVRVTKSGMEGIAKLVKVRKRKNPTITTRCISGSQLVKCS